MAYFSALGGTGGTSATITVTYSEDFYGLTITATNGTTTLTKTATSSGTLTFDVSEGGTWVVSGTVEGATYSESVDVTFEYTAPPLVALPDGSTALPINDIQMWLKCAAIRDKTTYTTLSDVLGDTETLIALCADSNACDYMARSTNWASGVAADSTAMLIVGKYNYCANALLGNSTWASAICNSTYFESVLNVKVPIMTSNTTPSGVAFADSVLAASSYYAYKCFSNVPDGTNDCWQSSAYSNGYVGYDFGYPVKLSKVKFAPYMAPNQDSRVNYYKIQGTNVASPTENDWVDLTETLTAPNTRESAYRATTQNVTINTSQTYSKYRVYVLDSNSYEISIVELQFYGRTPVSQTHTLIHSAVEDSIFYMDEGTPVPLCAIASGDTVDVDMSSFTGQTLTLVSTVAKDPDNLSNDFSMNVRITPNITEIYVMPIKSLYWWGHEDSDLENMTTANGWSNASGYTYGTPTHNKNSILFSTLGSGKISGVGMKASATIATLYSVTNGTAGSYLADSATKTHASPHAISTNSSGVMAKFTSTVNGTRYAWTGASDSGSATCYALWYE